MAEPERLPLEILQAGGKIPTSTSALVDPTQSQVCSFVDTIAHMQMNAAPRDGITADEMQSPTIKNAKRSSTELCPSLHLR